MYLSKFDLCRYIEGRGEARRGSRDRGATSRGGGCFPIAGSRRGGAAAGGGGEGSAHGSRHRRAEDTARVAAPPRPREGARRRRRESRDDEAHHGSMGRVARCLRRRVRRCRSRRPRRRRSGVGGRRGRVAALAVARGAAHPDVVSGALRAVRIIVHSFIHATRASFKSSVCFSISHHRCSNRAHAPPCSVSSRCGGGL